MSVEMPRVLFWNCSHGMVAKVDYIHHYLTALKPEIFFISEAEINKDRNYSCLSFQGYDLQVSKTVSCGKARLAAFIKVDSNFNRVSELENGLSEVMVFENKNLRVCGLYRPFKNLNGHTSGVAFDLLLKNLEILVKDNKDLIIGGDMNVNWLTKHPLLPKLSCWMENCGLLQMVTSNTCSQFVSKTDGIKLVESCIDLVFVKMPKKAETQPSAASDHSIIAFDLCQARKALQTVKKVVCDWRNYSKERAITCYLELGPTCNGSTARRLDDINNKLITVLNKVAPKRTV